MRRKNRRSVFVPLLCISHTTSLLEVISELSEVTIKCIERKSYRMQNCLCGNVNFRFIKVQFSNTRLIRFLPFIVNAGLSKKQQRKLSRRKRRKTASIVEAASNYADNDCSLDKLVAEENPQNEESSTRDRLPTIEELTSTTAAEEDNARLLKYIPLHRPRPTPKEWIREEEHSLLPVPLTARGNIEKSKVFNFVRLLC